MSVDYCAVIAFGVTVTDEVFDKVRGLIDDDLELGLDSDDFMFHANEWNDEGPFFGVRSIEVDAGTMSPMHGNVVNAGSIEQLMRLADRFNIPTDGFGYYLVNRVV